MRIRDSGGNLITIAAFALIACSTLHEGGANAHDSGFFVEIVAPGQLNESQLKYLIDKAQAGDVWQQAELGSLYLNGDGVSKDLTEAAKWFGRAAQKGSVRAQAALGELYETGSGVEKDLILAYFWKSISATGYLDWGAKDSLKHLEPQLSREQLHSAKALVARWLADHPRDPKNGDLM